MEGNDREMGQGGRDVELTVRDSERGVSDGKRHSDGRKAGGRALAGQARDEDQCPERLPGFAAGR